MPSLFDAISNLIASIVNSIFAVFQGIFAVFETLLQAVWGTISTALSAVVNLVAGLGKTAEGIIGFILGEYASLGIGFALTSDSRQYRRDWRSGYRRFLVCRLSAEAG